MGVKISELTEYANPIDEDFIPIVDSTNSATKKTTKAAFLQDIRQHRYSITTDEEIAENTDYEIPCYYKVGDDVLDIFYMGEKLIKGIHFIEVGETGAISNIIQFYNWGQSVPAGRTIEFVVRGVYSSES